VRYQRNIQGQSDELYWLYYVSVEYALKIFRTTGVYSWFTPPAQLLLSPRYLQSTTPSPSYHQLLCSQIRFAHVTTVLIVFTLRSPGFLSDQDPLWSISYHPNALSVRKLTDRSHSLSVSHPHPALQLQQHLHPALSTPARIWCSPALPTQPTLLMASIVEK